ncbi:MAG: hypothetical protein EA402_09030 [Planctomycetota bacterium]|nr:MAG: hypothetical protein EA402_09030 [Planctomycetota bacterium]
MLSDDDLLIVGCGRLGAGVALARPWRSVLGLRRSPASLPLPLIYGDAAAVATYEQPAFDRPFSHILLTATPGLRGGGPGNRLDQALRLLHHRWPQARMVYTASTAVYGDADGAVVDENAALSSDGRSPQLQEIEAAVKNFAQHVILRVGAIVGADRRPRRLDQKPLQVSGDPHRPFPFIHQEDLQQVIAYALWDRRMQGVWNCVAPLSLDYAAYYRGYLEQEGIDTSNLVIEGDGSQQPNRRIDATRLWQHLGPQAWLLPWQPGPSRIRPPI